MSYKIKTKRDASGKCIPQYENYTVENNVDSPARQILKQAKPKSTPFLVKDFLGNTIELTADWIAGFFDGEGTVTFFFNPQKSMNFGYQIQPAFILVQGESDFSLLTVIANFFGFGTVNVNHADDTSVRYQYRIVNLDFLIEVIIPFFRLVFLHTKKSKEFEIWAECTEYLYDYRDQFAAKPDLAITLMEKIKTMRYQGAQTKLTEKFIATCDKVILKIEAYKQNKRKGMV